MSLILAHCSILSRPSYAPSRILAASSVGLVSFRNEASGALTGLTRVRTFHQDDGHVFCTHSQLQDEIAQTLECIDRVYSLLGFESYTLALSTRPSHSMGDLKEWDHAEAALIQALEKNGKGYTIKQGDGAFYGPKIDIQINDALGRSHQTATVQLDFQLPQRFDLKYIDTDGEMKQPVIIHRAVMGSVERMLGILIEHYGGNWPFWLNHCQVIIVPVAASFNSYASEIKTRLKSKRMKFFVDVDLDTTTLSKKIRDAQVKKYGFILVVGQNEIDAGTVSVRGRDVDYGSMTVDDTVAMLERLTDEFK